MFNKIKSTEADLSLLTIMKFLDLMNGNILYLTRETDRLVKLVTSIKISDNAQKQVDDFYGPKDWERDISNACLKEDEKDLD